MRYLSISLPALTTGAFLAIAAAGAAAAAGLTVADCTTAWKASNASGSCGAQQARGSGETSLRAARISVATRTVTAPHPLFPWTTLDVEVQFCSIRVQCLRSGQSAVASGSCPTSFLGSVEDTKKLDNNNGTLEMN